MLVHALALTGCWLVLSTLALGLFGRRLVWVSALGSLFLILLIEIAGALIMRWLGLPLGEILVVSGLVLGLAFVVIRAAPTWNPAGHAAWVFFIAATVSYVGVALALTLLTPSSVGTLALGLVLLVMQIVGVTLALSYTYELLDVVCRRRWRRPEGRPPRLIARKRRAVARRGGLEMQDESTRSPTWYPRVALHVPCHDEPPDVLEQTLYQLARLDYPADRYHVFVVDNNTADPALWEPIEDLCDHLGFTFLHLEKWPGFKSGALNYALAITPEEFEIIGVVDADYLVTSDYLHDLVAYFDDPGLAFVQTPQDYRDYQPESTFYQRACYHAYRYFFDLSMPSRNERNAIIFGGTMGLIRADTLRAIGGWDEWCITEDAEASLRLLMRGYEGVYVNRSYGWGLMPLEFDALKRQRFRWCFGGIQILRKHWAALLPWSRRMRPVDECEAPGLTAAQRYHYLFGGLQWYGDALNLGFTTLLILTGALALSGHPLRLPILGGSLVLLPMLFWATSLARTLWGLRATRKCRWSEAIGAVGILWSLSWVVALASLQGAIRKRGVFLRTPKDERASVLRALRSTSIETALGIGCWALALALAAVSINSWLLVAQSPVLSLTSVGNTMKSGVWWSLGTTPLALSLFALLQGGIYLTAPAYCLLSLRSEQSARVVRRRADDAEGGGGVRERRLLLGVGAVAGALALVLVAAVTLPQSSAPVSLGAQNAISSLLGNDSSLLTPTTSPSTRPTRTVTPTVSTTQTPGGGTPTPGGTATPTPHPGATKTPNGGPTVTPPGPKGTPTPRR
jgi:cellulose synthase/poly-beta-1,6-N-acetylglucosamine synthase-like glycosyltransferase